MRDMEFQIVQAVFFDLGDTLVRAPRIWLPGAKALLTALKQRGLRVGVISNTSGLLSRQAILDILPVDFDLSVFEESLILFSSEIGKEKPNKAIFEEAIARAGIPARHCLYCSENLVETLVAQHLGMLSMRVQSAPNSDLTSIESALEEFIRHI